MNSVETVVVGRKTSGDGKLEVSRALAEVLGGDRTELGVRLHGRDLTGSVSVMECTCTKATASGKHEHHFVQCDAFRSLPVGAQLRIRAAPGHLELRESTGSESIDRD